MSDNELLSTPMKLILLIVFVIIVLISFIFVIDSGVLLRGFK